MIRRGAPILLACIAAASAAVCGCTVDQGSGGCAGFVPMDTDIATPADRACAVAQEGHVSKATTELTALTGATCNAICGSPATCTLPGDYLAAYVAAQPSALDSGAPDAAPSTSDGGSVVDASTSGCPALAPTAYVQLTCTSACTQ
jgi:hypothetical protein